MNRLEIFNEISIMAAAYHLFIFTDFEADPVQQYKAGWSIIAITTINIAINMLIMLRQTLKRARLSFMKYRFKFYEWRINRRKAKKEQAEDEEQKSKLAGVTTLVSKKKKKKRRNNKLGQRVNSESAMDGFETQPKILDNSIGIFSTNQRAQQEYNEYVSRQDTDMIV